MKKPALLLINFYRRLRRKWYTFLTKRMLPPYAIVGGNPATVIKYRDIEHFKALKQQAKFH